MQKNRYNEQKNYNYSRAVFEHSPVPSILVDKNGLILEINKIALHVFGITPDMDIKKLCGEIFGCPNAIKNKGKCGTLSLCNDCIIRSSLNKTFLNNENILKREGKFNRLVDDQIITFIYLVTTTLINIENEAFVLLNIEDITEQRKNEETLKASEKQLDAIFNFAYDGILLGHAKTKRLVAANNMICSMLGYSKPELLELSVADIHPEDELPKVISAFEKQLRREIRIAEMLPVKRKDGSVFYADVSSATVEIRGDMYLIGIFRDISERIETDRILKESEEKYKNIVETTENLIVIVDAAGMIKYVNHVAKRIFGLDIEKCIGKTAFDFIHPYDKEKTMAEFNKWITAGKSNFSFDNRQLSENGDIHHLHWNIHVNRDTNGEITDLVSIATDITKQKQAELDLKESEEKYRILVENQEEGFGITNFYEIFVYANPAAEKIFEVEKGALVGSNVMDFISDDDKKNILEQTTKRRKGETSTYEIRLKLKHNKTKNVLITAAPYHKENQLIGTMAVFRDITELKEKENQLHQYSKQLEEANATKDKFFSLLAHDLKNPFNNIWGFSKLLIKNLDKYDNEKIRKFATTIYDISKNTYELLENLLEWSRAQTGRIKYVPNNLIAENEVIEAINHASGLAEEKNITLNYNISDSIVVNADKNMLNTVLRNLIINAIKFTANNGKVTISVNQNERETVFMVSDTGIGMTETILNKLFKVGEKTSRPGTNNEKGTGLGLLLCKEFVEKHNGKIWVESEPEKGSDFKFTIPANLQ